MAWKLDCNSFESSNYHVTSTPCIPCCTANVGDSGYCTEIKPSEPSFAEQYLDFPQLNLDISEVYDHVHTQSKAACPVTSDGVILKNTHECETRLSDMTSGYSTESKLPELSSQSAEQHVEYFPPLNLDLSEEKLSTTCDCIRTRSSACDCIKQHVQSTDCECRSMLSDVASSFPPPDVVDRLEPECCSLTRHWLCVSVHKEPTVNDQKPFHISRSSHVDSISRLFCIPPIAAVILYHVSDADLCRYKLCCVVILDSSVSFIHHTVLAYGQ